MAKNCSFLKENQLRFTEDLTTADKALRQKLWPLVDAAKKEGKQAHFAGVCVIIEGKEICPPLSPQEYSLHLSRWTQQDPTMKECVTVSITSTIYSYSDQHLETCTEDICALS